MIKLRLKFNEKPYPGFLTGSDWGQLAELCQLLGFPPASVLLFPASLPKAVWSPLQTALKEKGMKGTPVPFSLPDRPTIRDVAALAEALPADISKQTVFLFGGSRFLSAADFALSLFRELPRVVSVPTTFTAQAEFPFWNRAFASSPTRAAAFQVNLARRDLLWLATDALTFLPDANFHLGTLSLLRLASLFDRQLFLFLEEKRPQILKKEPDVLVQALFKTYKIKTDVLLPTQFHVLLEEWYVRSLPVLLWPDLPPENLWGLDFLLRLKLSEAFEESHFPDLRRIESLFASLGLSKLLVPEKVNFLLSNLEKKPEAAFPESWVLLRGIGKAIVQSGIGKKAIIQALHRIVEEGR